jgi:hypothetical protein
MAPGSRRVLLSALMDHGVAPDRASLPKATSARHRARSVKARAPGSGDVERGAGRQLAIRCTRRQRWRVHLRARFINRGPDVEGVGRLIGGPNQMAELVTAGADAVLGSARLLQPAFPFFTMTLNGITRAWSTSCRWAAGTFRREGAPQVHQGWEHCVRHSSG